MRKYKIISNGSRILACHIDCITSEARCLSSEGIEFGPRPWKETNIYPFVYFGTICNMPSPAAARAAIAMYENRMINGSSRKASTVAEGISAVRVALANANGSLRKIKQRAQDGGFEDTVLDIDWSIDVIETALERLKERASLPLG